MEESEGLAYDDPHSGSDATIMEYSPPGPQLSLHDESADSPSNASRGFSPLLAGVAHGANAAVGACSCHVSIWCGHG